MNRYLSLYTAERLSEGNVADHVHVVVDVGDVEVRSGQHCSNPAQGIG
jgi:hypothetical protein